MSVGVLPVGHEHWNSVSAQSVNVVREHGPHEATWAHKLSELFPPTEPPMQSCVPEVATHAFDVGHQKQLICIGVVHVSHVEKDAQFGAVAQVVSSWQIPEGHVEVFTNSRQPSTD